MMKLFELRTQLINRLKQTFEANLLLNNQLQTVSLDTDVILSHFLKQNRTWITFHRDFEVTPQDCQLITEAIIKRSAGIPVAYITNTKSFFGLDFYVDENVLIPKPDTELLVEQAVKEIMKKTGEKKNSSPIKILDMCSGSGCVGISIAKELLDKGFENFEMTFADISPAALEITRRNWNSIMGASKKAVFSQTNLFGTISDTVFDIIATNPPYVPHKETMELLKDGRSEPVLALDGDVDSDSNYCGTQDGLSLIRRLVPQCYEHLTQGGTLLMETGEYNAEETAVLFEAAGLKNIRIEKDMNDMLRDVCGTKE